MKKLTLIIAAVAMSFILASCGNKEKELMQKATEFYSQNETELKAVDNFDGLTAFFQNFKQKFNDFTATYSDMKLSQETQDFLSNKAEAFKTLETQKAVELFTPYLEQMKKTFNQCNMLDVFLLSDEGEDKVEEKMLKMLGVDPAASEEEMKNSMAAALGIDPTTT